MLTAIRFLFAFLICLIALALPYSLRIIWFKLVSETVHLPFKLFGWTARFLIKQLEIKNPYE
jgi:hypothetical protein